MHCNISPTPAAMSKAWKQLKVKGYGFKSRKAFLEYMHSDALHYYPMIISNGCTVEALIYFDWYDPRFKTCRLHFFTAPSLSNPIALMREARRTIGQIMANGDISMLQAIIPCEHDRAVRVAMRIGFTPYARNKSFTALCL